MKAFLFSLFFIGHLFLSQASAATEQECNIPDPTKVVRELTDSMFFVADTIVGFNKKLSAAVSDCVLDTLNGAWNSVKGTGDCVSDPLACADSSWSAMKNAWGLIANISQEIKQAWQDLAHLSPGDLAKAICSSLGELAPSALLALLTAGAASGKLGLTIAKIMMKLKDIANLSKVKLKIGIDVLMELSDKALADLNALIKAGRKKDVDFILSGVSCELP